MTNVIKIDDAQIRRDQRIREANRPAVLRALRGGAGNSRAEELRAFENARLRELLAKTFSELAVHDSPEAAIQFTSAVVDAYRTGSCSNE